MEETLKAHKPNLDTTGLENSFDQFGRTIFEVLSAQQRTNQNLEEQFHRANETQEFQVEAMQDMAQANFQMKFDHMFAGVPMYDGTDPDSFDDWLCHGLKIRVFYFFYISQTLQMNWISVMAFLLNAVL